MAYQALYRTWRPQNFGDMIGQEVTTKTLRSAIMTGQMSHAYLFTGPRGTGKTSAAKIFAKAVNCLHPVDGEPDGTCEICLAADKGTLGDVIELDAASNNGVDEIRAIREDVNYAPTQAKYKVYIIDEVHMLSTGAFNALLKTLEEPPANVIFILATTEPQKIPATIISRTQRFDFKRIDAKASYNRMEYILKERGDTYDESALRVIANAADGGMRDALSILDQALSFGDGHVTLENALLVTGSVTQTLLGEYVQAVVKPDSKLALAKLEQVLSAGKDAGRFVEDLISYARDLLLNSEAPELISIVPDATFTELATQQAPEVWYKMIDTLNDTQQQLRYTNRPSIYLEVLTVKLSQPDINVQIPANSTPAPVAPTAQVATPKPVVDPAPISAAQPVVEHETPNQPVTPSQPATSQAVQQVTQPVRTAPKASGDNAAVFATLSAATRGDLDRVNAVWQDMIQTLDVAQQAILKVAKPIAASAQSMIIGFDFDVFRVKVLNNEALLNHIADKIRVMSQAEHERQLVLINNEDWPQIRAEFVKMHHPGGTPTHATTTQANQQLQQVVEEEVREEDASESATVQAAIDLFGTEIVETVAD
ncbi:MAG: DNA polymerase III subunit gamma/tau [Lactobacillaceae bacterium]|nr:DNA polymerase III subunit gamma/tau [Lactobacillaceae bacterium]